MTNRRKILTLKLFWIFLNSLDSNIQLVSEYFSENINFLDVIGRSIENKLTFDIYCKPTNSFTYVATVATLNMLKI